MAQILLSLGVLAVCACLVWRAPKTPWWIPLGAGMATLLLAGDASPAVRLALSSWLLLQFVKLAALLACDRRPKGWGAALYATVWPAIDPGGLEEQQGSIADAGRRFRRGYTKFFIGLAGCLATAWSAPYLDSALLGALGIAALLLTVHFGFSDMLTGALQSQGFGVKPLFDDPLSSRSLNDFWTRRWNLAFVQMNRILFMRPLTRSVGIRGAVFAAFVISGLLHELAISYPVKSGWGGPMVYFLIQAALLFTESKLKLTSRLWTWAAVLVPLPLLFHEQFRSVLVAPLFAEIGVWIHAQTFDSFWSQAFVLLGALHFVILVASVQVPRRLNWRVELDRLSPLNRKLMWTYGIFIVLCIVAFGVMTLALRPVLLAGSQVGLWLCGFIAVFWGLRLIVDNFVLTHADWPKGPEFEIGHTLLTTVFSVLTLGYSGFVIASLSS